NLKKIVPLSFAGHKNGVTAVGFTPDNRLVISGDRAGIINVWSTTSGKIEFSFHGHAGGEGQGVLSPRGEGYPVHSLAFTANGKYILSSGGPKATVVLWETETGRVVREWKESANPGESTKHVVFDREGRHLALAGSHREGEFETRGQVRVVDAETGNEVL